MQRIFLMRIVYHAVGYFCVAFSSGKITFRSTFGPENQFANKNKNNRVQILQNLAASPRTPPKNVLFSVLA
jgi:hypothetical protein